MRGNARIGIHLQDPDELRLLATEFLAFPAQTSHLSQLHCFRACVGEYVHAVAIFGYYSDCGQRGRFHG